MRIRSRVLAMTAAVALVAVACDPAEEIEEVDDDVGDDEVVDDEVGDDEALDDDDAVEDDEAVEDEDAVAAATDQLARGVDSLGVADSEHGEHLVDGEGMTLYVSLLDDPGEPRCVADCATVWPALATDGDPEWDEALDGDLVDSIERDDGVTQVTYDGRPLYLFVSDGESGDLRGQGLNNTWFVLGTDGEPLGDLPDDDELEELRARFEEDENG